MHPTKFGGNSYDPPPPPAPSQTTWLSANTLSSFRLLCFCLAWMSPRLFWLTFCISSNVNSLLIFSCLLLINHHTKLYCKHVCKYKLPNWLQTLWRPRCCYSCLKSLAQGQIQNKQMFDEWINKNVACLLQISNTVIYSLTFSNIQWNSNHDLVCVGMACVGVLAE